MALDDTKKSMNNKARILFYCIGLDDINRGIETFFREIFNTFADESTIEALLIKGSSNNPPSFTHSAKNEYVVTTLTRSSKLCKIIAALTHRSPYAVEQWSSFPEVVYLIRKFRPDVVFFSDPNIGVLLRRFRKWINVPFKLLFSNGGPCSPPFTWCDYVHQVAPFYLNEAIKYGEAISKHFFIPYGFNIPSVLITDVLEKQRIKAALGLPTDRPIILSVGWISSRHKRMDYIIKELANLPEPRPFLQMLGLIDEDSRQIIQLGGQLLGPEGFSAKSVPMNEVTKYYQASDIFALASLSEGFGRVYIESLLHGLPTIAHRNQVTEAVLAEAGILTDLAIEGGLSSIITNVLNKKTSLGDFERENRRQHAIQRFSWSKLKGKYLSMFQNVAKQSLGN